MNYKKTLFGFLVVLVAIGTFASPVMGATLTVNPDGTGDYRTIQAAVDAASADDTVEVEPGTYYETVYVSTSGVSIVSSNGGTVNIVANRANGTTAFSHDTGLTTEPSIGGNISLHNETRYQVGDSSNADYSDIQTAVNNSNSGDKIAIEPGTYNESVNVTSDYIMFVSTDMSSNVTVDASNSSHGEAFRTNGNNVYIHESIDTVSAVLGGGGSGSSGLSGSTAGVPNVIWGIVVIAGIFIAYQRKDE